MWERKAQKASFNGNVLNILSTTLDGGKRLHVSELPYADLPHIKVMGAKARTISIEVIFVGINSLVDANATVLELETNPEGALEHPYLGELSLVFETYSQSFSTKKGLVTLSLKFYRQGQAIELISLDEKTSSQFVAAVIDASNTLFVDAVDNASADTIDAMKFDFNSVLSALRNMANRSSQSSVELAAIHRQIEDGFTAVEMIKNAPSALSDHFSAVMGSLKSAIASDDKLTVTTSGTAIATQSLSETINLDAEFTHCNLQITLGVILLSEELDILASVDEVDISTLSDYSLTQMIQNLSVIQNQLDDRANEVSKAATFESMALVDAVESLRENINEQATKLIDFQQTLYEYQVPGSRPLLCIAQTLETETSALNSLNNIKHPLFVSGALQVNHV